MTITMTKMKTKTKTRMKARTKIQSSFSIIAVFLLAVFSLASTNIIALGTSSASLLKQKNVSNTANTSSSKSTSAGAVAVADADTNTNVKIRANTNTNVKSNTKDKVNTSPKATNQITICIDPGHQKKGMKELEPIGPGAKIKKASVSSGTTGVFTKKPEYQLNLEVSLKIRKYLEGLGYKVVMTREKNEVTLSNIARAKIANASGAVIFVRIHGNGSTSKKTNGCSVLYPSEKGIYTKNIWKQSKLAAQLVEKELKKETGAKSMGSVPRADLTGLNWSRIPVILVEMGFMSNVEEDIKLSEGNYQEKIANGIAKGIDAYVKGLDVK